MSDRIQPVAEMVEHLYGDRAEAEKGCITVGASAREAMLKRHLRAMVRGFMTCGHTDAARTLSEYVEELRG